MAAAQVLAPSSAFHPGFRAAPLIKEPTSIIKPSGNDDFDPKKHLAFRTPSKIYTMKELGLPEDHGISPIAVSEPFPLFTEEAILRMRSEVLNKDVMEKCQFSSNLAQAQLRGYADKYAPFIYDAWKNPETLKAISSIAGIDLTLEMDLEIGHVNLSVKSEEEKDEELKAFKEGGSKEPIVGWHTDSYPFVCVLMLSDCSNMIGGETALRTGTGEILKVRGPQMGCAVVLQGRYIEHQALAAFGSTERITMVTSFRPRSPLVRDDTVLTTVRPISNLGELYTQFSEYRFEILEERIRRQLKEMREARTLGRRVATAKLKAFVAEQQRFLEHMNREMLDDDKVVMGEVDDSHLLTKPNKKAKVAHEE
ncbi:Kanamycin B dioxygenase [Pleurostoma richardsiae]|uniref:Kanamycin B dioxygenase n=1 Tax=Pleurostoma richardsiae TaxID=41990 RepID=A0AA38VFS2_9PEZI|nr:Kanamycin B dioxygenase [Pleurostoma richardsiae]